MNIKNSLPLLIALYGSCLLAACGSSNSITPPPPPQSKPLAIASSAPPMGWVGIPYAEKISGYCQPSGQTCYTCFPGASTRSCSSGYKTLYQSDFQLSAAGGNPPYSWTWAPQSNSNLPPGVELATTGSFSGAPTTPGTYNVALTVTDSGSPSSSQSASYSITVFASNQLQMTSGVLPGGTIGQAYGGRQVDCGLSFVGWPLSGSGGTPPYSWSWSAATGSSIPPGLQISGASGTCTNGDRSYINSATYVGGTPTAAGTYNVVLTVSDSAPQPAQVSASFSIAIASNQPPPNGTVGQTYGGAISAYENHCAATFTGWSPDLGAQWSWSAAPGSSLPPGLGIGNESYTCGGSTRCCVTVTSPPLLSGVPTAAGNYHVIVAVGGSSANFTITIAAPTNATASTKEVSQSSQRRYKLVDVAGLGGPDSYLPLPFFEGTTVAALSNQRTFAGFADTVSADPYAPLCFFDCSVVHTLQLQNGFTVDLGALPGAPGLSSAPTWISANGLVVGFSENAAIDPLLGIPEVRAVLWKNGSITNLRTLEGGHESIANAVNSRGQVVGYSNNNVADPDSFAGWATQTRAFLWENGVMQDLGTLGGTDAVALYVNEEGQIVGQSYTPNSVINSVSGCGGDTSPLTLHAFIWGHGKMTDLGTLGGSCTLPYSLNNLGQVVGQSNLTGDQTSHPFIWEHGTMRDLQTLGGTYGYAVWVNDAEEVVGASSPQGDQVLFAFLWKNGAMTKLGPLTGDPCSVADATNAAGQVVGGSGGFSTGGVFPACELNTVEHAVLWEDGQAIDLNAFVPAGSTLTLNEAVFVNDSGEISGFASLPDGETHAFVLIPCSADEIAGCQEATANTNATRVISEADTIPLPIRKQMSANPKALGLVTRSVRNR